MKKIKFQFDASLIGGDVEEYDALLVLEDFAIYRRDDNFYLDRVKPVLGKEDVFTDIIGSESLFVPLGKIDENKPAPTLEKVAEKLMNMNGLELICRHYDVYGEGVSLFK